MIGGGQAVFSCLPNTDFRIFPKGRFRPALEHIAQNFEYDQIRITSLPEAATQLAASLPDRVVYEFHTSTVGVVESELERLDIDSLEAIQTPSDWLTHLVARRLTRTQASKCVTVPNLVDRDTFNLSVVPADRQLDDGLVPLLWVGRFDKGKNFNDFLRLMSILPEHYIAVIVVSYETEPNRVSRALQEARAYGMADRICLHLNLSQIQLAQLYTWTRDRGGLFVSTSLAESFGYGIAEALACGLPTVAYRVGGVPEIPNFDTPLSLLPVGDVYGLASAAKELSDVRP